MRFSFLKKDTVSTLKEIEATPNTVRKPATNDALYGEDGEVVTLESVEQKIKALQWLVKPGNGQSSDAVEALEAKLRTLEAIRDKLRPNV